MPNENGGNGFSPLGILLLALFGTFLWETVPLDSSRPANKADVNFRNTVSARLWQDPYKAIFNDPVIKADVEKTEKDKQIQNCDIVSIAENWLKKAAPQKQFLNKKVRILAVMLGMEEDVVSEELRRRTRYAVVSGLGQAGYIPEQTSRIQYCKWDQPGNKDLSEIIVPYELYKQDCNTVDKTNCEGIIVLWLNESRFETEPFQEILSLAKNIVKQPAYSASICKNKCSLFILGPQNSQTLTQLAKTVNQNYVDDKLKVAKPYQQQTAACAKKIPELSADESAQSDIHSRALQVYSGRQHECSETEKSDKALNALPEAIDLSAIHILSPTATAELYPDQPLQFKKHIDALSASNIDKENKRPITFLRTIKTDNELTAVLVNELKKRGIESDSSKVALIAEWDSVFGRLLPKSFKRQYCNGVCEDGVIQRFSYLRGIDGHHLGHHSGGSSDNQQTTDNAVDVLAQNDQKLMRRPAGTGQFDYLRRLAQELKHMDTQDKYNEQNSHKKGIRAIGILGSDVYDKLLILRALRPQFPDAVFFTTDMDAQLLHPSDFNWTRNLLIASAFGLSLAKDIQTHIPPFRSVYQTSVFLSTLLVAKYHYPEYESNKQPDASYFPDYRRNDLLMAQMPVLLYEVGRKGAVLLGDENNHLSTHKSLYPATAVAPYKTIEIITIFSVLFGLCLMLYVLSPPDGEKRKSINRQLFYTISLLFILFGYVTLLANDLSLFEEPFSFTEGVSIWPTIYIRIICLLLCCYFIYRILYQDLLPGELEQYRIKNAEQLESGQQYQSGLEKRQLLTPLTASIMLVLGMFGLILYFKHIAKLVLYLYWTGVFLSCLLIIYYQTILEFIKNKLLRNKFNINRHIKTFLRCEFNTALTSILVVLVFCLGLIGMALTMQGFRQELLLAYWVLPMLLILSIYHKKIAFQTVDSLLRFQKLSIFDYMQHYLALGNKAQRIMRSMILWLIFLMLASLIFSITGQEQMPIRGDTVAFVNKLVLISCVFSMLFLIYLVVDAYRLCTYWIRGLVNNTSIAWDCELLKSICKERNIDEQHGEILLKIELIARETEKLCGLIYYPFIIIMLMLLSRSNYFDNWGLPAGIAIVIFINIVMLFMSGRRIRFQAENLRSSSIEKLQLELIRLKGQNSAGHSCHVEQIKLLILEIEQKRNGIFQPFRQQPLIKASLLLLGAIGLSIGEYAMLFG